MGADAEYIASICCWSSGETRVKIHRGPYWAAAMKASLDAGHPVTLPRTASVADGLMAVRPGDLTFEHVRAFVDRVITVEDDQIINAVLWTFANAKIVAEPSGAASVAAVLSHQVDLEGPIAAIVSGGNVGLETIAGFKESRKTSDAGNS